MSDGKPGEIMDAYGDWVDFIQNAGGIQSALPNADEDVIELSEDEVKSLGGASSSSGWVSTGQGGSSSGSGTIYTSSGSSSSTTSGPWTTYSFNYNTLAPPKPILKNNIVFVIITSDGHCLEMQEQNPITGRELIGLSKFTTLVSSMVIVAMATAAMGTAPYEVIWSDLIRTLGISRHFVVGKPSVADYDDKGDVLYLFLHDPKPNKP